jgi:hypothetical protein
MLSMAPPKNHAVGGTLTVVQLESIWYEMRLFGCHGNTNWQSCTLCGYTLNFRRNLLHH